MIGMISKILAGSFVQSEIKKLKDHLNEAARSVDAMRVMKIELYRLADGILAEGQATSKEKLDAWFEAKRAQLKLWAGQ